MTDETYWNAFNRAVARAAFADEMQRRAETSESELAALKEQNAGCSRALTKLMTEHRELVEAVEEMIEMDGCIAEYSHILSKLLPETPEVG